MTKTTKPSGLPEVSPLDMWTFLLSTVRYSLGRSTYMTNYAPELVAKYHDYLEDHQLRQVEREIVQELLRFRIVGGMKKLADHTTWLTWAVKLNRLRRSRAVKPV